MKKTSMNITEPDQSKQSAQSETPADAVDNTGLDADAHASTESPVDDLNKRLMLRVGIAVALIFALLGGLAVLDDMNTNVSVKKHGTGTIASNQPAPAASPPVTGTESTPDASGVQVPPLNGEAETPPPDRTAAAEESSEAPTVPTPAPESPPATPAAPATQRPLTRPATPRLAMMRPSEAANASRLPSPSAAATAALARPASPQVLSAPTHAPASRPLSQAQSQVTPRAAASSGMLLQLGVFTNTAHAEELRAKLELNGIPAQIESRVQVGPFASREEAEQMRERLKKLGLEGGVLVATKK